jgi:hypothetical protein
MIVDSQQFEGYQRLIAIVCDLALVIDMDVLLRQSIHTSKDQPGDSSSIKINNSYLIL